MNDQVTSKEIARLPFLKTAAVLWGIGALGAGAVLPYVFALQAEVLDQVTAQTGLGTVTLGLLSWFQSALMVAGAVAAGLWASRRLGLDTPLIGRMLGAATELRPFVRLAIVLGVIAGALIVFLDLAVFAPLMPPELLASGDAAAGWGFVWRGALASLYGGVTEEILLRLFLLSLIALPLRALLSRDRTRLGAGTFWAANLLAALVFGLGHLPATAALVELTPTVVVRALTLNGLAGLAFGWLFWRRGLEAAMLSHFCADIVLHVALPAALILRG